MNVALDIDATGYDSAAEALATAYTTVKTAHSDLVGALSGSAGMGGDDKSSEDWVRSYDPAARDLEAAIADLGTGWGTLSAITSTSGANHRDANAGSVIGGGGAAAADAPAELSPLTSSPPPGALGADTEGMPDGWDLVVDHLQGWAWPSADVGRLRDAAAAWRSAAGMIGHTCADGASARSHLAGQRSPEITTAGAAISDVETSAVDITGACNELASACDDYANQVEATRDTIKGLLRDLVIEVAATAAVSGLASLVTFGGAAAAGAAVAIQRAISCARRIIQALLALKGIRAVATLVRSVSKLTDVRNVLRRFRSFRPRRRRPGHGPGGPKKKPDGNKPDGNKPGDDKPDDDKPGDDKPDGDDSDVPDPPPATPKPDGPYDVDNMRGAREDDIHRAIPDDWESKPLKKGDGVRYFDPDNPGNVVSVEKGWPGAAPGNVHGGPYVKISRNGQIERIPLEGNPAL